MRDDGKRWIFATVHGLGDVVFLASTPITTDEVVKARKITRFTIGRDPSGAMTGKGVSKMPFYGLGLVNDPISIMPSSIAIYGLAPTELAKACNSAWSDIEIADNGDLKRIDWGRK